MFRLHVVVALMVAVLGLSDRARAAPQIEIRSPVDQNDSASHVQAPSAVPETPTDPRPIFFPRISYTEEKGVSLTVPEPASLIVWLVLGFGVGAARFRRRRQVWQAWWSRWEE